MEELKPIAIIAVDPGKRTGVAVWRQDLGIDMFEFEVGEFFDFIHTWVHNLHAQGYDIRIVYEAFIITVNTAKNTQASWSLELIGVLKFLAHRYQLPTTKQAPAVGKTFGTDGKLRYLGWFRKGKGWSGHANDAARHLATYAAQRGLIFTKDQLIEMADV